jgi:hypothetical protein
LAFGADAAAAPGEHFERRVRPVLMERCVPCHGPEKQKSALRLDSGAGVYRGGSRGPAVVAGDPAGSLLYQAIAPGGELDMPPDGPLGEEAIDDIRQWIAAGAAWPDYDPATLSEQDDGMEKAREHWAFQPVARPPVPVVQDTAWPRNPVDHFILEKAEAAGLPMAPRADKATLLRRVTFDLTGLPPTPDALRAFLDDDSPDAFATVVDGLLSSPQYGERWARHWLDLVRYTDSFDSRANTLTDPVEIWRYRDWVVRAFNDDMRYDQFLRYQIAGDLIPAEDGGFNRDGLVATGVLAIGNWPQGDADKEKMVCDIVDDQVDLVTRGFLGLTVSCARCHDHKFEPISTADYYGLAGIFFSSSILPGPGAKTEGSPILHLPLASKEELAERAAREARLAELRAQRDALLLEYRGAFARSEAQRAGDYLLAALAEQVPAGLAPSAPLHAEAVKKWKSFLGERPGTLDVLKRDIQNLPGLHSRHGVKDMPSAVLNSTGKDQQYITIIQPSDTIVLHPATDQPAMVLWQSPVDGAVSISATLADADPTCGNGFTYEIIANMQTVTSGAVDNGMTGKVATAPLTVARHDQITLSIGPREDYACDSTVVDWTITADTGETWDFRSEVRDTFLDPGPWPDHAGRPEVWYLRDPNTGRPGTPLLKPLWPLLEAIASGAKEAGALAEFASQLQSELLSGAAGSDPARTAAYEELVGAEGPFWLDKPPAPEGSPLPDIERELLALEANPPPPLDLAVGIQEGAVPDTAYKGTFDVRIHKRGDYNKLGDVVPRRMPVVLAGESQPPIVEGSGRRELAEWIAGRDNPLTARAMVNRIWLHHFGAGITLTPGDLGTRGDTPSHPELLDYLSSQFMDSGWSIKAMHRLMLNSATYQQSSTAAGEALQQDPENRLFTRMNRSRVEAEVLRDSLLAVTERLDLTPGGPAYDDLNLPRRTLYLKTNRSDRTTFAMLFDAADPTAIVPERTEATVAPQALFLLNHPFMLSAAETLAANMATLADSEIALIRRLYPQLYSRQPTPWEIETGVAFLHENGYPQPEALSSFCLALLASNEFVFVD